jgi:hypothetical protein
MPDPTRPSMGAGPRQLEVAVLVTLVVVLGASLPLLVHPWYDPTNDGSMYIATARALAAGQGYSYLGQPFVIRPPGFSCLIAPFLAWRGTDFAALNALVSVLGAVGILLFYAWGRTRLGPLLAGLMALVLWFNPGYQRLCNQVMSDVPGWTALLATLLFARRWRQAPTRPGTVLLGVAIALSSLLRSGNLLLLPALLVSEPLERIMGRTPEPWRRLVERLGVLLLSVVVVLAPWSLRNRWVAPPPPAEQTLLYSYGSGMWHTDMGDPRSPRVPLSEVAARIEVQGPRLLGTLGQRLGEGRPTGSDLALATAFLLALLAGALRTRDPGAILALGTVVVVAFYFGYAGRLLLPVYGLALPATLEGLRDLVARLLGQRAGTGVAALAALTLLGVDWHPREGWGEIRALHEAFQAEARAVSGRLGPEPAVLGAYRPWHHAVYLEREVWGLEQFVRRAGGDPSAVREPIERYGLDFLLLTPLGLPPSVQREERRLAAWVSKTLGVPDHGLVPVR